MADAHAEASSATTLSSPKLSSSLSPATNLMDRLPFELKTAVYRSCLDEGGKPLLLRLMATSKELQELGRPFIYRDITFTLPEGYKINRKVKDETLDLFVSLSREHGHLVMSVRLQRAAQGKVMEQLELSILRWSAFVPSLPHLTSLERLDISEVTSLTGTEPRYDGDDHLLRAAPGLAKTLTSLRLVGKVEQYPMYPSRLAEVVLALPLLTDLELTDVATEHWTSKPEYYASLKAAIGTLRHLKRFSIDYVANRFLVGLQISGPLEELDDRNSTTSLPEVMDLIQHHESTLHTLRVVGMLGIGGQIISDELATLQFPHLRRLTLEDHLDISFISRFDASPLQFLRFSQVNSDYLQEVYAADPSAEATSVAGTLRLIEVHKDTLKRLEVRIMHWRDTRDMMGRIEEELAAGEDTRGTRALARWRVVMDRCSELGIETAWK